MKQNKLQIFLKVLSVRWVRVCSLLFLAGVVFYLLFVNYTEPTELGIARNKITGETWVQETGGWKITKPWVWVSVVDLRPIRVAVHSAGHGYCAKLVQFDKTHWKEFVSTEGFRYYWWANRFSFNSGYDEEYRGMKDIMRGYAFSTKKYPFIRVLIEYDK
jgi:hypothetical protein